jgi:hypothetical protein
VCLVGFQYFGTFQDRLGGFLTYPASTRLNLQIDAASREEGPEMAKLLAASPLLRAVRGKASDFVPEARLQFAISTLNLVYPGSNQGLSVTGMSASTRPIVDAVTSRCGAVIVNAAAPKVEDGLTVPSGVTWTEGLPVVVPSRGFADAMWRLGDIGVSLRLIELSKVRGVAFVFCAQNQTQGALPDIGAAGLHSPYFC